MCSGKLFQKSFSLPLLTTEPVQGLKDHILASITCPQGLSCPGIQVMSQRVLADHSSSKASLKYSQCHQHILNNENGSWPCVLHLQPCLPFQVYFNWCELLKQWMFLSAFLKGNRYIKYRRLQGFKIKSYKHRLNYMLFIPLRISCSWRFVPTFQNYFYLHSHLEAFKTQERGNASADITDNTELKSVSSYSQTTDGNRENTQGSWDYLRQSCTGPSMGRQQWGKVILAQPLHKNTWEKQQGKHCLNLCFHDASKDCLTTFLRGSLITCLCSKAAMTKRNWEITNSHPQGNSFSRLFWLCFSSLA